MTDPEMPITESDEKTTVLLISQTQNFIRVALETLANRGIPGMVAGDAQAALDFLDKNDCGLVLIDDCLPPRVLLSQDSSGGSPANKDDAIELLSKIRTGRPELPAVMAAANEEKQTKHQIIETAVRAMQAGCRDFVLQPVSRKTLEKLLDTIVPNNPVHTIDSTVEGTGCVYKIVGKSPSLVQTVNLARRVAPTSAPVLITGESGTGKELISYVVHYNSRRAQGPFVKVNCAALSDTLLESELFGHEKGAFTGALTQRKGRFEMANGGTLLLDEISETPLRFQAKLLRVLEQQDFQRVGGNDNVKVDVRVISTTNKDLLQQVADGRFRRDLYYRLCGIRLMVSPLRQRKEDVCDLVWHFVNHYCGQVNRRITRLDPEMMEIFSKYHWPGNIRQLRNVVLTSLVLGVGETLSLADVSWLFDELQPLPEIAKAEKRCQEPFSDCDSMATPPRFALPAPASPDASRGGGQSEAVGCKPKGELAGIPLAQLERQAILETLRQTKGNQLMAARALGISDRTLRDKIKRYRQQGTFTAKHPSTSSGQAVESAEKNNKKEVLSVLAP